MEIYENTIIYIITPGGLWTGGVNSCHQLCYKLRRFKYNAFIYYYFLGLNANAGTHPNALCYNNPVAEKLIDSPENIIVIPESSASRVLFYPHARKSLWWLSVNFYYTHVYCSIKELSAVNPFDILTPSACHHFAGSVYAKKYLELFGVHKDKITMLESYMGQWLTQKAFIKLDVKKEDVVTFNPEKGFEFTKQIINYAKANGHLIRFMPLSGLSQEEMAAVYKLSKVHMDFGEFPGRERIPREAAIFDLCVITGKKGASKYYEDVPIPDKYKFDQNKENLPRILSCITDCLLNYEERAADFTEYKRFALGLERTFEKQIRENFVRM
jgi:hypothetical protein